MADFFQVIVLLYKAFSIVSGIVGMGVTAGAYDRGAYFNLLEIYCHQQRVAKMNEDKAAGKDVPAPKSCAEGWMVHWAAIFGGVALFLTIVLLFVTQLEKRMPKLVKRIDFKVQCVAGGFYLFSALLLLIFRGTMMESDWWDCAYDTLKGLPSFTDYNQYYHVDVDSMKRMLATLPGNCEARRNYVFREDLLECGMNSMAGAGLASVCAAALIRLLMCEVEGEPVMIQQQGERIHPTDDPAVRNYNDRLNNNLIPSILSADIDNN